MILMVNLAEVRALPKIDLHRHLDGDVRPDTILELAEKERVKLPARDAIGLEKYFAELRSRSVQQLFTEGFGKVTSLMQSPENLSRVAYEEVRNLRQDNVIYGEIRFAPYYHTGESAYYGHLKDGTKAGMSYEEVITAVAGGLEKGRKDFGVRTGIIACVNRELEAEQGVKIVQAAVRCIDRGVVGIDLACDEATYPPERHSDAFRFTFDSAIGRTVHAGEFGNQPYKNMKTALQILLADRIGQAIPLQKHDDLITLIRDNKVGVEMCPESNLVTGFIKSRSELGIYKLLREKVLVSVNSDDPAIFGYTLSDSFSRLMEECSFGLREMRRLQLNAAGTAFLKEDGKRSLAERINAAYHS
jgi:adenosine deaminase